MTYADRKAKRHRLGGKVSKNAFLKRVVKSPKKRAALQAMNTHQAGLAYLRDEAKRRKG